MVLSVRVPCRFDIELLMFGEWFKSTGSPGDSTVRDRSARIVETSSTFGGSTTYRDGVSQIKGTKRPW